MTKSEMTGALLQAKRASGLSYAQLSEQLGLGAVYLASCCHGENSMDARGAAALGQALALPAELIAALQEYPSKGASFGANAVPSDPLIYRLYEIVLVYGASLKDVIQEQFGDGIMSAIDFTMDVRKQEDPKGDRVVLTLNGKFLPYKKW